MEDRKEQKGLADFMQELVVQGEKLKNPPLPEKPETGRWYSIFKDGYVTANGSPYHGSMRIGTENNLMVIFDGGGVAWDAYTAAHPTDFASSDPDQFYSQEVDPLAYVSLHLGLGQDDDRNLFRNWSRIVIHYASADFHIGNADYEYTGTDGEKHILHHHGFRNYRMVLETAMRFIPSPDKLLIIGASAGAFGASALAEDVMSHFPACENVTVCCDSSIIRLDWRKPAEEMWKASPEITVQLVSEDFAIDNLACLYRKYGSRVRYLYCQSVRDACFVLYLNWIERGVFKASAEGRREFFEVLKDYVRKLKSEVPEIGFFFFDIPDPSSEETKAIGLTTHTMVVSPEYADPLGREMSFMEWLMSAVDGNVVSVGEELLME